MAARELPAGLLEEAKNYLDMTWADEEADRKLTGILLRGMAYLDHVAGVALPYAQEGTERALLFDYARYGRANSLQDFASDFSGELLGLHIFGEVEQHGASAPSV